MVEPSSTTVNINSTCRDCENLTKSFWTASLLARSTRSVSILLDKWCTVCSNLFYKQQIISNDSLAIWHIWQCHRSSQIGIKNTPFIYFCGILHVAKPRSLRYPITRLLNGRWICCDMTPIKAPLHTHSWPHLSNTTCLLVPRPLRTIEEWTYLLTSK